METYCALITGDGEGCALRREPEELTDADKAAFAESILVLRGAAACGVMADGSSAELLDATGRIYRPRAT